MPIVINFTFTAWVRLSWLTVDASLLGSVRFAPQDGSLRTAPTRTQKEGTLQEKVGTSPHAADGLERVESFFF